MKEFYVSDMDARFHLDPLTRLHMYGESRSIIGMYINIIMAVVILCIACINFINLTTASSFGRLKEISILDFSWQSRSRRCSPGRLM